MATIPVIPGVSIATKGVLNRPIKDLICAILFGGIGNMLNGNLACLQANINELLADAGMANLADLRNALTELQSELTALQSHLGITDTLARVNQAIGDVQRVLALGGMCPIPLRAPRIPNVLNDILRGYFGAGRSILSDLGRLGKPQLCINGAGGVNTGSYNPDSIIGSLQRKLGNLNSIPQRQIDNYVRRINGVKNAIRSQIDRELFPDFRHKHNLLTGRPKVPGEPAVTIADVNRAHTQALQINSGLRQTGSYPIKSKGIAYQNAWAPVLGPSVYALAVDTLTPADPTLIRQVPVYDYCGRLVGYQEDVVAGDREAEGGDPQVDAEIVPLPLNHTMLWIDGTAEDPTRIGWAEEGNTSLQLVGAAGNQRQVEALNLNPEITIYRGRSHLFVLPPSSEQEFYIYETKVEGGQRVPDITKRFSKGLNRFESGEMLDEANGRNEDDVDWIDLSLPPEERNTGEPPAAWKRKDLYPDGMTLMINVGGQIDNLYNSGISHSSGASGFDAQGKKTGIVSFAIPLDAPDQLFYTGGAANLAQGALNLKLPTLSINDISFNEGTTGYFTVSLSESINQTVTVKYNTVNNTATSTEDYNSATGTLTFSPGNISKNIPISASIDSISESAETFKVELSDPVNATINNGTGIGTIVNGTGLQQPIPIELTVPPPLIKNYLVSETSDFKFDIMFIGKGTINTNTGTKIVNGTNTFFTEEINVGDIIRKPTGERVGIVETILSNTKIELAENALYSLSDESFAITGPINLIKGRTYTFTLNNLSSLAFHIATVEENLDDDGVMLEEEWPDYLAYSNEDGSRFGLLKLA